MLYSLIESEATNGFDEIYLKALSFNHELGRKRGIDAALHNNNLDALVLPTSGYSVTTPSAIAGYPMVTGRPGIHIHCCVRKCSLAPQYLLVSIQKTPR